MIDHIVILIFSLAFLIIGAEKFVEYAAKLAKTLGVSEFIIGLTVTAFGTSIPELASSVTASLNQYSGLIVGNIIGSNIANIGLIIGISSYLITIKTNKKMFAREGYILISSVIIFLIFAYDNVIIRLEAIILILIYILYILFLLRTDKKEEKQYTFHDFLRYVFDFQYITSVRSRLLKRALDKSPSRRTVKDEEIIKSHKGELIKDIILMIIAGFAIIMGADYLVQESIWFANFFSLPQTLIGLTIIALGTSLPELSVSISACRKKQSNLILGNVLGSNIANILFIGGVSSLISPLRVAEESVVNTIPILLFFSIVLLYSIKLNWKIDRKKGILLILSYIVFILLAFVYGWS